MTTRYRRNWTSHTEFLYDGTSASDSGYAAEERMDMRHEKVKTPKGAWRPPTPYWREVEEGDVWSYGLNGSLTYQYFNHSEPWTRTTRTGGANSSGFYFDPLPQMPDWMQTQAEYKALAKAKDAKVNLGQAFAERMQTVGLVLSSLNRIRDGVLAVRRMDPRYALRALGFNGRPTKFKNVGTPFQLWLEIQYGWKPLLSDVAGAYNAIVAADAKDPDRYSITCRASVKHHEETRRTITDGIGIATIDSTKVVTLDQSTHVRLDYSMRNDAVHAAAAIGLTNPLELGWELLPFSFVADWFLPVGTYLSSLDATLGLDFRGGSRSEKTVQESRVVDWRVRPDPYGSFSGPFSASGAGRQMFFRRTPYDASPSPRAPYFKNPLSGIHLMNAISLLAGACTNSKLKVNVK